MRKSLILTTLLISSIILAGCDSIFKNNTPTNSSFDATTSLIYDTPLNRGNGNITITTNQQVKQLIAIPYNISQSSGNILTQINMTDDSGNSLQYQLTPKNKLQLASEQNTLDNLLTQYQERMIKKTLEIKQDRNHSENIYSDLQPKSAPIHNDGNFYKMKNLSDDSYIKSHAKLIATYQTCYLYLEDGATISEANIKELGAFFDTIYNKETSTFGNVALDIDNDSKVIIVIAALPQSGNEYIAGYFDPQNQLSRTKFPYSNEAEMVYITTLDKNNQWLAQSKDTLAHEFQHLINFSIRSKFVSSTTIHKETWLNEGLSMIAGDLMQVSNHNVPDYNVHVNSYLNGNNTWNTSLCFWESSLANYGASYLFIRYFTDRYGEAALKEVVNSKSSGNNALLGFDSSHYTFNDLLVNWFTAMILKNQHLNELISNNYYGNIDPKYKYSSEIALNNITFPNDPSKLYLSGTAGAFIIPNDIIKTNKINLTIRANSSYIKLRLIAIPATQ